MFAVYCVRGKTCDLVNRVSIAGILCAHISSTAATIKPKKGDPMPWKLSGHDLCCAVRERFGFEEDAASCKVVADVTYGRSDALILEINGVWGFSYYKWTPIVLRMSAVFEGDRWRKSNPVRHFRLSSQQQTKQYFVHEFLYLQRGHREGTRGWGRMGYTNAALLYPDALAHLLGQIGFVSKSR